MALSADQQAMLEMLLSSGQSYGDLAELLGLQEDEVRARARTALTELGGQDPDRNVGLTDYLLGQADPIGRADAARHLGANPADAELAAKIAQQLQELVPGAELPKLPGAPAGAGFMRRPSAPSGPKALRPQLPPGRARLFAALGGGAVLLVVIVLAVAGVFGGDDEPSASTASTTSTDTTGTDTDTVGTNGEEISRIELTPTGGGDALGVASIGITTADQPYLDLVIKDLEPAPQGKVYVIWFLLDEQQGYPLSPIATDNKGSFQDRFAIPAPAIEVAARARFINVSLAGIQEVQKKIQAALQDEQLTIERPGQTVLQGEVPAGEQQQGDSAQGDGG
jgi:hypothetical protein